jgi:hypothetical protein
MQKIVSNKVVNQMIDDFLNNRKKILKHDIETIKMFIKVRNAKIPTDFENKIKERHSFLDTHYTLTLDKIEKLTGRIIDRSVFGRKKDIKKSLGDRFFNMVSSELQSFSKDNIGSHHRLYFSSEKPSSPSEWNTMYIKRNKVKIKKAINGIIERLEEGFQYGVYGGLAVTKKQKEKMITRVREYAYLFLKYDSYHGLVIQEACIIFAAKKLDKRFRHSSDEVDSKGVDGHLNSIPVSVKPKNFKFSKYAGLKAVGVPTIEYKNNKNGTIEIDITELKGL